MMDFWMGWVTSRTSPQTEGQITDPSFFWKIKVHTLKAWNPPTLTPIIGKTFSQKGQGNAEPSLSRSFTALHQVVFLPGCPWNQGPIILIIESRA